MRENVSHFPFDRRSVRRLTVRATGREAVIHLTRSAEGTISRDAEGPGQRAESFGLETPPHVVRVPRGARASEHSA